MLEKRYLRSFLDDQTNPAVLDLLHETLNLGIGRQSGKDERKLQVGEDGDEVS